MTVAAAAPGQRLRAHAHALSQTRAELLSLGGALRRTIDRGRSVDGDEERALQRLYLEIFRKDVGRVLSEALDGPSPLPLRLRVDDFSLASFPWGALCPPDVGGRPLALDPRLRVRRAVDEPRPLTRRRWTGPSAS